MSCMQKVLLRRGFPTDYQHQALQATHSTILSSKGLVWKSSHTHTDAAAAPQLGPGATNYNDSMSNTAVGPCCLLLRNSREQASKQHTSRARRKALVMQTTDAALIDDNSNHTKEIQNDASFPFRLRLVSLSLLTKGGGRVSQQQPPNS